MLLILTFASLSERDKFEYLYERYKKLLLHKAYDVLKDYSLDIEKTVYYIENFKLDNVVMTLEHTGDTSIFDGLTQISVNGYSAYGSSGNGYCLLAFEKQDVLYVLTCAHDINTLVELSESILSV